VGLAPFVVENLMTIYLRFADLKALGIGRNSYNPETVD